MLKQVKETRTCLIKTWPRAGSSDIEQPPPDREGLSKLAVVLSNAAAAALATASRLAVSGALQSHFTGPKADRLNPGCMESSYYEAALHYPSSVDCPQSEVALTP
jgi:hypothetical protein